MASEKKEVIIVKKKKRKDKKDKNKKKKTTKKKTQGRGITVNIKLEKAIGEVKAKAPKTARGFAPKVASIRGQRSRGGGELNTRQAEINTNLLNNVYAIRAQATKQQEEYKKLAKEQGGTIKTLSNNLGILQNQVTQLGIQVMNPPKPPAPAPTPSTSQRALITMGSVGSATMGAVGSTMGAIGSVGGAIGSATSATIGAVGSYMGRPQQQITLNVPPAPAPAPAPAPLALPAPPQPSEEEQQYRRNMGRAISNMVENQRQLNQQQQGLYQGVQLLVDSQHGIHNRLAGIEQAGHQIAGNQGTALALEAIGDDGEDEAQVQPEQQAQPPPLPPPPPPLMETISEEDPTRMSSSDDPQEEEKADLLIEEVKTPDESVIKQDKKMRGPAKGEIRTAFTPAQQQIILEIAGDTLGYDRKQMTQFYKSSDIYKELADEYQGNERAIKNRITKVKKGLEQE